MPPPARQKTDDIDLEHLHDTLEIHAKRGGLEQAFSFGEYDRLDKQHAVCGRDLAMQKDFLVDLQAVGENLLFKYTDLKPAYSRLVKKFPVILARFNVAERDYIAGNFATCTMTMCTHARRLKDEQKFREACRGLASFHVCRLEEIRDLVMAEEPSLPVKAGKPGTTVKTPEKKDLPASPSWKKILEMEIPATQSAEEEEPSEQEGLQALADSPVPPRKRDLKLNMKRPAASAAKSPKKATKKPKPLKRPASAGLPGKAWYLMPYNEKKNWAVAVREKGQGKQVVAVSKFGDKKKNWAAAEKLLKMLEEGESYEYVQAQKQKLWKYSWRLGKVQAKKNVHSFGG